MCVVEPRRAYTRRSCACPFVHRKSRNSVGATKSGGRKPPVDHGNVLAMTMLHMRETADAASANRIAIAVAAITAL